MIILFLGENNMKSEYLKAFEKLVNEIYGKVDEGVFENEHLDEYLCQILKGDYNIPEKRFKKTVDDFILKGKFKNSALFRNVPDIYICKDDCFMCVRPKDRTRPYTMTLQYFPEQKMVSLKFLDGELKSEQCGIKCNRTFFADFLEMSTKATDICEYPENGDMSFDSLVRNLAIPYIKKTAGINFNESDLQNVKKEKEILLGNRKFWYVEEEQKDFDQPAQELLFYNYSPCKNQKNIFFCHTDLEVFIKNKDGWVHSTKRDTHTEKAIEHYKETGNFVFRGQTAQIFNFFKDSDPMTYYEFTENTELIEREKRKIEEENEKAKREQLLHEAGKEKEKPAKKVAPKTKTAKEEKTAKSTASSKPKTAKTKATTTKSAEKPAEKQTKTTSSKKKTGAEKNAKPAKNLNEESQMGNE